MNDYKMNVLKEDSLKARSLWVLVVLFIWLVPKQDGIAQVAIADNIQLNTYENIDLKKIMVSVDFKNMPFNEAIMDLSKSTIVKFNFNTDILNKNEKITYKKENISLHDLLSDIMPSEVSYLTVRDIVVFKREDVDKSLQEVVTGTVIDTETGEPLPGVNVIIHGTSVGTSTDRDGLYELTVESLQDTLVFSFIGYQSHEIPIEGRTTIDAELYMQAVQGKELIVVGYGTQRKENITGAVSAISANEIAQVPVANITTAIAGKLPGLFMNQTTGEPGNDAPTLSLRGIGHPLVVVDGKVGRDFSRLNPNEIESITILKDAASTAVYGVSGGAGVLLVTTKKGTIGRPQFSYSMNYGLQTTANYPTFVNSAEFAELKNEASTNLGGELVYSQEEIELFRLGTDPDYPNFDYYDYFIRDYTPQMQHDITVSGGSENIQYFFLLGQTKQEAMWNGGNQDFSVYNFRSNIDASINDNLDVSVVIGGRNEERNNLVQDSYLMASWMQYQWPIHTPKTPDGRISNNNIGLSAYLDTDLTGYIEDSRYSFQGDLTINYSVPFLNGLNIRASVTQDLYFREEKQWRKQYGLYSWDEATQTSVQVGSRETNSMQLADWKDSKVHFQTSLNYVDNYFDHHNISALLLYEEREDWGTQFWASRTGYIVPIDQLFAGPDADKDNYGTAFDDGRQSFVGRFNYDFQDRYLFEYSFRYDGSPKFPADNRWGFFSGISLGWRLSEESFINHNIRFINNFLLRGSWGKLGNDSTGNFQFLTGYNYPSTNYMLGYNTITNGLIDAGLPNQNITWEESETINLGIDISMWQGIFEVQADIFYRQRDGILAVRNQQLPSTFGASLPAENINSDNTRGMEIEVRYNNSAGDIRYSISPNVSFQRSKWNHIEQREFNSQYDRWRNDSQNRWKNIWWGLNAIGQFTSQEEINNSPIQDGQGNSTLLPGDIKFEDFNGDGVIDDLDNQIIGRGGFPEIYYGLGLNVDWKNLSIDMNWQGAGNYNIQQQTYLIQPFHNNMSTYAYFMDRWHRQDISDPDSEWIPGKYPSTRNDGTVNNNRNSSFWLLDGTYLRLKFLNISYTSSIFEAVGVPQLTIYISGQNLLTLSRTGYIDPEAPSGRLSYYPQQKLYNLGINIQF